MATTFLHVAPVQPEPATARISALGSLATVGVGMLTGTAVGVVLRAWMRLVSDEPEFSWSGTVFIVGAFTVLGTSAGVVAAGRRRGWRGLLLLVRVVGTVLGLACFAGAGAVMLFTVVPGGLAVARREWPRWLRGALAALAVVGSTGIAVGFVEVPMGRRLLALPVFLTACAVECRLFAELFAPSRGPIGRRARNVLLVLPVLGVALVVLSAIGF